jgi:FMN phosphatase YigB (HAD superfamily)
MAVAVKALFFDVFGTLVDWRNSIAREAEALLKPKGITLDYFAFADAWRGEYQGAMEEVRAGRIGFCKLDILHRRISNSRSSALPSKISARMRNATSIWPGIGSTPGLTCRPV